MASNYSTNYQLNQWEPTDQVQRTDFNADNAKIDAALKTNADAITAETAARTAAVALCGNCQIYTTSYVGTGTYGQDNARSITCPKPPVVVMFQSGTGEASIAFAPYGAGHAIGMKEVAVSSVRWLGNTFSWWGVNATQHMNVVNVTYHVIVLMAVD